ncbi:class E sortase [Streptomyces sp. NPDC046977]|uniref:class E sortase n=1 Tax=Streptomyces sp. NPDC046977 TaxID=3154703 RepID=UPI0033F7DAE2
MTTSHRLLRGASDAALTLGLLLVLFATYLLWWTNHTAQAQARQEVHRLEQQWAQSDRVGIPDRAGESAAATKSDGSRRPAKDRSPGAGAPAELRSFAILRIPRLALNVPVTEGVDKHRILDRGFVGHYPGTALPGREGNFAVAAHRNTHGEPFRYLNRMRPGDIVTVTTADGDFQYRIDSVLPQTSPSDSATIAPVPTTSLAHRMRAVGYDIPGRYLTLTTCTPEFTSRYRMVVWGHLVGVR